MTADDCGGYGMRDGQLLSIAEVQRGLLCGCRCVRCGKPLIAKKGSIRRHHFAHFETTDCRGAIETALHLLAKELIAQLDAIILPPYEFSRKRRTKTGIPVSYQAPIAGGGKVSIQKTWIEKSEGDFVADIVIESGDKQLIIEVAVTHKVAREKLRKLRRHNVPAIEIRLDPADSYLSRDELKNKLHGDPGTKAWLFHPKQREAEGRFASLFREALAASRMRTRTYPVSKPRRGIALQKTSYRSGWQPDSEFERVGYEYLRIHGRWPSIKVGRERWPHLFKLKGR